VFYISLINNRLLNRTKLHSFNNKNKEKRQK